MTGTIGGSFEGPSHDRLVYVTTCLIGQQVEVQVKDGSIYSGIFHATNTEKDFGMILYFHFILILVVLKTFFVFLWHNLEDSCFLCFILFFNGMDRILTIVLL